jgi:hypothetical protein
MKKLLFILSALATGPLGLWAQTTVSNTTYTNGQNVTVTDGVSITTSSTVTVASGADVTYASGGTVTLAPGFSVAIGGVFHVYVNTDSEGDGMADYWEVVNGLDPATNDASSDKDSDGLSNLTEYLLGTDVDGGSTNSSGGSSIDLKIHQPSED